MDELDTLVQRLRSEVRGQSANRSGTWRRYDDSIASMSAEQKSWVCKQESVLRAKSEMYGQFIDYLFDINKEAFISVGDGVYRKTCEDYIDEIQKTASSFVSRSEILEKQNEDLIKRNEELQKRLDKYMREQNESMAAGRSGCSGKDDSQSVVRTGIDTRQSCDNLELFPNES